MWFEDLVGFGETSRAAVLDGIEIDGEVLRSRVNGREMRCGALELASLGELRTGADGVRASLAGRLRLREVVGDVRALHADAANAGATFQVASQFNLLEMAAPGVTPDAGVGIYENDHTQGPACAVACGAATICRNYFDDAGLRELNRRLPDPMGEAWDQLRAALRVGTLRDAEVTLEGAGHCVDQVFCSALPVAYNLPSAELFESFARLVLEAAYEATFCAAVMTAVRTGNRLLYLTQLGGGAFGNDTAWIVDAIERAIGRFVDVELDVAIVSHRRSEPAVRSLIGRVGDEGRSVLG